ncbi:hypothetical protein BT96DRAFT_1021457 [Gymnopus androsaceus JB14]|uniref:F-box domain-containing protein n=1 Tax=Gymnopus androsaceus JB14 TaxID=1447944 RepID=A0A6A4HGE1_9AGAR|nr:hypothetical protein BT96DRAFT_1021457 [Gymnopus androsaceus JB14]
MPRRSVRIREAAAGDSNTQDASSTTSPGRKHGRDESDVDYEEEQLAEEPSRKRAKKSSEDTQSKSDSNKDDQSTELSPKKTKQRMPEQFRKVRGRLGMLERLAKDVPLDVIFEIFSYLDPSDLLRLARTSNDLRGILMSKSSESIWRTARSNVEGLPPLPLDFNEPQYAHLLYEAYCHICNHKGRCETVLWSFRMRCCKSCAKDTFPAYNDPGFRSTLPAVFQSNEILPRERIQGSTKWHRVEVGNIQIATRLKAEFEALQTPKDRSVWISRKKKERRALDVHGRLCEAWHRARLNKRTGELGDIRKQRKNAILERLAEIGNHKTVKQSKKLTEYGWNSIETELVAMLSEHKTERLAEERRRLLIQRYSRLAKEYEDIRSASDLREPFPAVGDILTYKAFENLSEHLPNIINEWRPAKVQEIIEIMQKSLPTASVADLDLVTSVFQCTHCSAHIHYPQMFYHLCCTHDPPADGVSAERLETYGGVGPWSSRRIVWSNNGSQIAQTIVEACALDPATTTIQDLHSANPLIECTTCYKDPSRHNYYYADPGRAFMRWPFALGHSSSSPPHNLVIDSFGEETQQILACETERHAYANYHEACCAHCHKPVVRSFKCLVDHLKANHGDSVDLEKLGASSVEKPQAIQEHWYWNPRLPLRGLGQEFRYKGPPADAATTPTAGITAPSISTNTTTTSTSTDNSAGTLDQS